MGTYTHLRSPAQDMVPVPEEEVYTFSIGDMIPDWLSAEGIGPHSSIAELAPLFARADAIHRIDAITLKEVLSAWEDGAITGMDAILAMYFRRCLPADALLAALCTLIRARDAADIEGRAA